MYKNFVCIVFLCCFVENLKLNIIMNTEKTSLENESHVLAAGRLFTTMLIKSDKQKKKTKKAKQSKY